MATIEKLTVQTPVSIEHIFFFFSSDPFSGNVANNNAKMLLDLRKQMGDSFHEKSLTFVMYINIYI